MRPWRIVRMLALGVGLRVFIELCHVWGGCGAFTYPQAVWNGRTFVPTGRIVTVCNWRC